MREAVGSALIFLSPIFLSKHGSYFAAASASSSLAIVGGTGESDTEADYLMNSISW
jgi:hypothetical protein